MELPISLAYFRIVCILFLCPVLIICSIDLKIISTILKFPLLKLLGKISIPLLFWHMPLIKIYQITHICSPLPQEIRFISYIIILFAWCYFTSYSFPKYIRQLINRDKTNTSLKLCTFKKPSYLLRWFYIFLSPFVHIGLNQIDLLHTV